MAYYTGQAEGAMLRLFYLGMEDITHHRKRQPSADLELRLPILNTWE